MAKATQSPVKTKQLCHAHARQLLQDIQKPLHFTTHEHVSLQAVNSVGWERHRYSEDSTVEGRTLASST